MRTTRPLVSVSASREVYGSDLMKSAPLRLSQHLANGIRTDHLPQLSVVANATRVDAEEPVVTLPQGQPTRLLLGGS